jgi:hypothetical protein
MNLEGLAARAEIETLTVNPIKQRTLHLVLPGALLAVVVLVPFLNKAYTIDVSS